MQPLLDDLSQLEGESSLPKVPRFLHYLCIAQLIFVTIATIIAFMDVESVLGTGPIATFLGIVLGVLSIKKQANLMLWFALSAPIFCLFCFFLIVVLYWSPRDAQYPISILTAIYLFGICSYYYKYLRPQRYHYH